MLDDPLIEQLNRGYNLAAVRLLEAIKEKKGRT